MKINIKNATKKEDLKLARITLTENIAMSKKNIPLDQRKIVLSNIKLMTSEIKRLTNLK